MRKASHNNFIQTISRRKTLIIQYDCLSFVLHMKEYSKLFYKSKEWERCRQNYLKSVGGLCESCLSRGLITPAKIVHHKVFLTPNNINDPTITLDWNNLQAVCKRCHEDIHDNCGRKNPKRYFVDEFGGVIGIDL